MKRNKHIVLLSALVITAASFTGCDQIFSLTPADQDDSVASEEASVQQSTTSLMNLDSETHTEESADIPVSYGTTVTHIPIRASKKQSSVQSSEESSAASDDTSELTSDNLSEGTEESSEKTSEEISEETSEEEYSYIPSDYEIAYTALDDYAKEMKQSGTQKVRTSGNTTGTTQLLWWVNQCKIGDYNYDGIPEMIVQYYIGLNDRWSEQGVAIELIEYHDDELISYKRAGDFSSYIRPSDRSYIKHAVVDELFVDEDSHFGILTTYPSGTAPVSIVYDTYAIEEEKVRHVRNLMITADSYNGKNTVKDLEHTSYAMIGDKLLTYNFRSASPGGNSVDLSQAYGVSLQNDMLNLPLIYDFTVSDAAVRQMLWTSNYNTTDVNFCSLDEIETAYKTPGGYSEASF